jgi:hypothetical protein
MSGRHYRSKVVRQRKERPTSLEVDNLNLAESDDERGQLGELYESVRRRLEQDVGPERNSLEAELSERDVDLKVALGGLGNLLGERLELLVEGRSSLALLLLELDLVLVSVAVLALSVTCLVERDVGGLPDELDVLMQEEET